MYSIELYITSIELYTNNRCSKFLANIFIFGCAMAETPDKDDEVTFCDAFLIFDFAVRQNKWLFWNPDKKRFLKDPGSWWNASKILLQTPLLDVGSFDHVLKAFKYCWNASKILLHTHLLDVPIRPPFKSFQILDENKTGKCTFTHYPRVESNYKCIVII